METVYFVLVIAGAVVWGLWMRGVMRPKPGPQVVAKIRGPGRYATAAVGESNYRQNFVKALGGESDESRHVRLEAGLELEESNPHDSQAVAVTLSGNVVGYLSKADARAFRAALKRAGHRHRSYVVDAVVKGGWDRGARGKGDFGIWLDLP